jgi:predicted metal-dependent HD superfamily phosphohydrolase
MSDPDFDGVERIVRFLLQGLDPNLRYHSIHHTLDDVLPNAIELISHCNKLSDEEKLIVKTAALLHDVGFLDRYENNEEKGCDQAKHLLPKFGYTQHQLDEVCVCIMATKMPQNPGNHLLSQIVCDADLLYIATDSFFDRSNALREERQLVLGKTYTDNEWIQKNIDFLNKHQFFCDFVKESHKDKKLENKNRLVQLLKSTTK